MNEITSKRKKKQTNEEMHHMHQRPSGGGIRAM